MDFSQYTVDSYGNVHLSGDLNAWMLSSSWRRHGLYHRICQQEYRSQHGGLPPARAAADDLRDHGVCLLPRVLADEECSAFTQSIDGYVEGLARDGLTGLPDTYFVPWSQYRAGILRRVLPEILSPDLTAKIEDYYGSHFQVLSVSLNRYLAEMGRDVSFQWHRDEEPPQQLHLMVYLSGASDEGGRTEVLDRATTRRAAENGYSYPPLGERSDDLTEILGSDTLAGTAIVPDLNAGGALMFAAPRNLHRGVKPRVGQRDTLLILLMPSPLPWQARLGANFRQVLSSGKHTTCCLLNPFDEFSEATLEQHGQAPEWAKLGEMFPSDDSLY